MASEPPLPLENGKQDAPVHPSSLTSSSEVPRGSESMSPMQKDVVSLPSPTPVAQQAPAIPAIDSTCNSLVPYVANVSVQLPISSDAKLLPNGIYVAATEVELDLDEEKKRDKEHKKRSKNWTRPETLKLIRLRTDLAPRFAKTGRKSELWDEIAEALRRDRFSRDAQQCRDKWEKLMAGYKEVRDGIKEREDNPFYDELHPLLSGKSSKRDREREHDSELEVRGRQLVRDVTGELKREHPVKDAEEEAPSKASARAENLAGEDDDVLEEKSTMRKRKRVAKFVAVTDLHAVQSLLETVISRQQKIFRDLLDAMERKEQLREQMRQEREEKWRAEERAQRCIFNNAMVVLTQKLVGERVVTTGPGLSGSLACSPMGHQGPKKRSKNWKRAEVLQLIRRRGEMEVRFAKSTRRAILWDELAESLGAQGIKRDGKQCREKWDKLMSEYKDVLDGKREQGDSPYFAELTAIVGGRPGEAA